MEITLSTQERSAEALSSARLDQAVAAIRNDGYAVLEDIVARDHLDQLRERMDQDSQRLIAAQQWAGAGGLPGHLQQGPPPFAPFVFRDIVANPFVIQVSQALLGDRFFNSFYNGNTNCAETEAARRAIVPQIRGNSRKGSVLIRDMRLWHRGVPNQSDRPRHMIAMIHNIGWFNRGRSLTFGRGSESAFTESALDYNAVFTDEPIDYLFGKKR